METTSLVPLFVTWHETRDKALKVLDEGNDIDPDLRLTVQMILWQAWFSTRDRYFVTTLYYEQARVPTRRMNLQRHIMAMKEQMRREFPEMIAEIESNIDQLGRDDPARLIDPGFRDTVEDSLTKILGLI
jgi:hypothetical protein